MTPPKNRRLARRHFLLGTAAASTSALLGCDRGGVVGGAPRDRTTPSTTAPPATTTRSAPASRALAGRWQLMDFPSSEGRVDPQMAALLDPQTAPTTPLLVALHGRGEAGRGLEAGARGWRDDYSLEKTDTALRRGKLDEADLAGFVRAERLTRLNASLAAHAYQGVAVVCPYTPALEDRSFAGSAGFARFVLDELLPASRQRLALPPERARTGIDGVSMGGRLALFVGLAHPETFGAVGALQPAIIEDEAPFLSELAARARASQPVALRLVTSDDDRFRKAVETFSKRMDLDRVAHELVVTPGPHDYEWNRGPGGIEMLLWHERVLRGLPSP